MHRWDNIVNRIRALDGSSSFLRPTPFKLLIRAADEGPVIIVNISGIRSDAIILRRGAEPEIIKLPNATPEEIRRIASKMEDAVVGARQVSEVDEVLRLLWHCIVQPVAGRLEVLGLARGSRIWWCPPSRWCSIVLAAVTRRRCIPTQTTKAPQHLHLLLHFHPLRPHLDSKPLSKLSRPAQYPRNWSATTGWKGRRGRRAPLCG